MTDNAEQGEQPSDPVTRSGIGVGVVPDDYADGAAEQEFEESGSIGDDRGAAPNQADAQRSDIPPADQNTPLAETKAAESRLEAVDEWGTGDDDAPFAAPGADREDGGAT